MTDYFALFQEARRPWLDPEKLKEKYFALVRERPPDAELNEAFRVLGNPQLRLQHLLQLQGVDQNVRREIPSSLADLFWETGQLLRAVDGWQSKNADTQSALSRALLGGERLKLQEAVRALEARLDAAYETELEKLRTSQLENSPNDERNLLQLHDAFAYLTRWRDQVQERRLLLA